MHCPTLHFLLRLIHCLPLIDHLALVLLLPSTSLSLPVLLFLCLRSLLINLHAMLSLPGDGLRRERSKGRGGGRTVAELRSADQRAKPTATACGSRGGTTGLRGSDLREALIGELQLWKEDRDSAQH